MCVSLVEVMFRMFPTSQPMTVEKINDEINKCVENMELFVLMIIF